MYANLHKRSRNIATGAALLSVTLLCVLLCSASFISLTPQQPARKIYSSITFRAAPPTAQAHPSPALVEKPPESTPAPARQSMPKTPVTNKKPPPKTKQVKQHVQKKNVPPPAKRPSPAKKKKSRPQKQTKVSQPATPIISEPATATNPPAITSKEQLPHPDFPAATPLPPSQTERQADIELAIQEVAAAVERHKKYPKAARRAGYGGQVKLRIHISAAGRVTNCSINKSSGRKRLDKAALDAANSLIGQDIVSVILKEELVVTVPVRFFLQ